jgi:predicted TIM-barrel fold metal-dependent hydrolase
MIITDAQVHTWPAESAERPWEPGAAAYAHRRSFVVDDLLSAMDGAGVVRAVLVPPGWEGDRNDYALDAVASYPDRLAVMIRLDVTTPMAASEVAACVAAPGVLGVRLTFTRGDAREWLANGVADWLWPVLESQGVPLAIYASGNLNAVRRIAIRHPDLQIVLDHAGLPIGARGTSLVAALDDACLFGGLPNVAIKASSMPSYSDEPYPFPSLHASIRQMIDAFGPDRVFWGSDLTRLKCSYAEAVRLFTEAAGLTTREQELIMGEGLARWLSWPV